MDTVIAPGVVVADRYRVGELLGEGGMGTVWVAEHLELGRKVALKVLQKSIASDAEMRQRFDREAHTLAAMQHPNVVALNDYGVWEGHPYLVMELLEGRTLRDLLDHERTLPFERARNIAQQILRALDYAHGRGVIHRDLKPGNVFLQALPDTSDHVKLLDFGFAKFTKQPAGSFVSKDGIAVGTPAYMAPEQGGSVVDARADVYSAGVLLFEMLAARRPFEGEPLEMIRARKEHAAPKLAEVREGVTVTPALESCLARALTRDPNERFAGAAEFATALGALSTMAVSGGASIAPRVSAEGKTEQLDSMELAQAEVPRSRLPWVIGVVVVVIVLAWLWMR